MEPPADKKFYGTVTVTERGQIVIPAEARRDFNIRTGDKLLVFGDLKKGIWVANLDILLNNIEGGREIFKAISPWLEKQEKE